ncbi:hypothetical protein PR202_ga03542 [Eleusine coracana subsp. coracana]|uniref:PGG domain-containing protein n=1 Tax=Eleusine coracana subsp. coracana TaxID=191504 RepID=A0AAV5BPE9_ELECO|nr:hypothetical protein PR202_ga03542 [Eleusine coracana subsp. coracana]
MHEKQASRKPQVSTEYQLKKYLLLLETLVATVTYAVGLNQPGGVWQETFDGHHASDPILRDTHYLRYTIFHYCNAAAFMASIVVCLLLLVLDDKSGTVQLCCGCNKQEGESLKHAHSPKKQGEDVENQNSDANKQIEEREELRVVLMVLATFAVIITYVFGLNPRGGFWSSSEDGHHWHRSSHFMTPIVAPTML